VLQSIVAPGYKPSVSVFKPPGKLTPRKLGTNDQQEYVPEGSSLIGPDGKMIEPGQDKDQESQQSN
jgi:hypothetical protein